MDRFKKGVILAYFPRKKIKLKDKWVRLRGVAGRIGLTTKARQRLEWIIFYNTVGKCNVKATAEYFGISRKTLHKYLKRFDEGDLRSLEELSKAPQRTRTWTVTADEEERVIKIRNFSKCKWGKAKIVEKYLEIYEEKISTNKVQKVINKNNLYPDTKERNLRLKRRNRRKKKIYIHTFEKKPFLGYLWHTDTIIIWWYGVRRVIFTAIEETTKIAFARVYSNSLSRSGKDFLERLIYLSNGQIQNIHHDNGSEFEKDFEKACKDLGINQIYSRVRTPKDNPALERFNWTVQDEWLSVSETGLDDIHDANLDLTNWLVTYNNVRPHQSLDYMTPLAYALKRYKVSPMWSARTCD
jgi:transposase InsO family protein